MNKWISSCLALLLALSPVAVTSAGAAEPNSPPVITHEPVRQGVRGQSLTLKAKVLDDRGEVQSVTLFYTLAKDAAPFKSTLHPAGLDFYIGTIEAGVLTDVSTISYYIEAQDGLGATRETPWYVVNLRDPKAAVPGGNGTGTIPPPGGKDKEDGISMGLIAGGAAVVIGGALLLANSDSGGGGGGGDDGGNATTNSGTYAGSAVTCFTPPGGTAACDNRSMSIVVDANGQVFSDTLLPGSALTAQLSGNDFTLKGVTGTDSTNGTGEIFFNGTVLDNRIVGNITGTAPTPTGSGVYSGSFSGTK